MSLRSGLRSYDICARLAGDDFAVVLPGCDRALAKRKGFALQQAVALMPFFAAPGRQVGLSVSVGAATFPGDGQSPGGLVAAAGRRMYEDKSSRKETLVDLGELSSA